jgi:hypothetical protein
MYRAIEHRLSELLQRAHATPLRLAPPLPSVHVARTPARHDAFTDPHDAAYYASAVRWSALAPPTLAATRPTTNVVSAPTQYSLAAMRSAIVTADSFRDSFTLGTDEADDTSPMAVGSLQDSDLQQSLAIPSAAHVRNHVAVRCAGVISSLDLIRALRLRVPKIAGTCVCVRESSSSSQRLLHCRGLCCNLRSHCNACLSERDVHFAAPAAAAAPPAAL